MKNLQFFQNFQENFAIFSKFFEILSNFWRKFGHQFRKLRNMHSQGVRGAEPPDASEFFGNLSRKINGNLRFFDNSNGIFAIFSNFLYNFIEFFAEIVPIIQENIVICICRGFGGRSLPKLENFQKSYSKIKWKPTIFLKIFMNSERSFYLKRYF